MRIKKEPNRKHHGMHEGVTKSKQVRQQTQEFTSTKKLNKVLTRITPGYRQQTQEIQERHGTDVRTKTEELTKREATMQT